MNRNATGRAPGLEDRGGTEIEHRQSWRQWVLNSPVIRLQVSITLILTVTATLMTVVIWKQTSDTLYHQVNSYSLLLRKNALTRVYDHLDTHFRIATEDNEMVARQLHAQKFADKDVKNNGFNGRVRELLWPRFRLKTQYTSLYFARDADAATAGYTRFSNKTIFFTVMGAGNFTADGYIVDNQTGETLGVQRLPERLDLREELKGEMQYPYLHSSLRLARYASHVFLHITTRVTQGTLVDASTNATLTSGINGMLQAAYLLEGLSKFMSQLRLLGGAMFAMTEEGLLIAVSDDTPPYKIDPQSNQKVFVKASEMNNTALAGAARWLESQNRTTKSLIDDPLYASNVEIGGSRYFIDTAGVKVKLMNMCLVVVTPRASIMGVVDRSSRRIAIFMSCVVIACLAVAVGLLLLLTKHMGNELRLKKELSQQLEAKERAEACTASARLFLANLSHDLRTPMAAVIGLLDIMSGNGLDTEQKALMEQAQSNAETLHTLLNTVLDISKVEAGTLELQCAPFDLQHELETITDLFYLEGMKKGVEVVLDLPEDLPQVIGDCFRVRQIFANLLSNSMRFTQSGHVLIRGFVLDQERTNEVSI